MTEYVEGIFVQDKATAEGEIKLAESDLSRSEDRLDWATRMFEKGYVSKAAKVSEELTLKKARFALEQAESKLKVLLDYTKAKTIKELESEVEKARSDELAKKATWELEVSKEKKLERADQGLQDPGTQRRSGGLCQRSQPELRQQPASDRGRRDRSRASEDLQLAGHHQDAGQHQGPRIPDRQAVTAKMKARIRVDAFADQVLTGTVKDVAPLPDPSSFFSSDIKVYTTHVTIDEPLPGLRPGMTAQVEILVDRRENVLDRPGAGDPPVQWQRSCHQEGGRPLRSDRGRSGRFQREVRADRQRASRKATSSS